MKYAGYTISILLIFMLISCRKKFGQDGVVEYQGQTFIDNNKVEQYLEEEINKNPDVAENYIKLFDLKQREGKPVEATNLINEALKKLPHNDKVLSTYASWKLNNREPREALKILEDSRDPEELSPQLLKLFALTHLVLRDFPRSLDFVNKALTIDKNDWQLHYIKADNYLQLHDTTEAIDHFKDAFQLHPIDSTFNKLFSIAMARSDKRLASQYLQQYHQLRPDDKIWLLRSAIYFRSENKMDTSNSLLREYLQFNPQSSEAHAELAHNFLVIGQYDSTIFYSDRAISFDDRESQARLLKSMALDKQYKYAEAKSEIEALLERDSINTNALEELDKLNKKIAYLREMKRIDEQRKDIESLKPIKNIGPLSQQ